MTSDFRALIVGYGSIGQRHASILSDMGARVEVVSGRQDVPGKRYGSIAEVVDLQGVEYGVIANPTDRHLTSLNELQRLNYQGKLLIEKPLFSHPPQTALPEGLPWFVGYNLRFHPVIQALREQLRHRKILSMRVYVGSYLPHWRPGRDYRQVASSAASAKEGGGVLRELSHELDYLLFLTGNWRKVSAFGSRCSELEIQGEDLFALLVETQHCPIATVQMNYFDRKTRREILCVCEGGWVRADLVENTLETEQGTTSCKVERNDSYTAMHREVLAQPTDNLCTLKQGCAVLELIEAAEKSASQGIHVLKS